MKTPPGLVPFNLQDALKGRKIVHRDGRKVVDSKHFPTALVWARFAVQFDNGGAAFFGEDGAIGGADYCLFHPAEPVIVPFDLVKWKAGWKAVYRDGSEPAGVVSVQAKNLIVSVQQNGDAWDHTPQGYAANMSPAYELDLFLIQPEGQA